MSLTTFLGVPLNEAIDRPHIHAALLPLNIVSVEKGFPEVSQCSGSMMSMMNNSMNYLVKKRRNEQRKEGYYPISGAFIILIIQHIYY